MTRHIAYCAALLILTGTALAQAPADPPAAAADEPAAATAEPVAATSEAAAATADGAAAEPADPAAAANAPQAAGGPRGLAGMSILGNQETPTSLVIVPWKSSEIGAGIGVSRALDTGIHAVDRDVFMRELRYYEIRTGGGN